jgi:hypothetical protein
VARPLVLDDKMGWGEWALRSVPERFLWRSLLRDLGLANRVLRDFALGMLHRPHPQMPGRSVSEVLEEERRYLCPAGRA